MPNRIVMDGQPIEREFIASEILTPGELVEFGGSDDIQPHSTADVNAAPMFVREQRENAGAGIDDDIAAQDTATAVFPRTGEKVFAWLDAGENVARGDFLSSQGNGNLGAEANTVDPTSTTAEDVEGEAAVAVAAEAVDNSGSTTRTRIEVIIV